MQITKEQLHNAFMVYLEEDIASKASGVTKFASYFIIAGLYGHPEKTVGALLNNPLIQMTDVVESNGLINVDSLYNASRTAMEKCGKITISGITFSSADIDKIFNIIQRGG
jgi:hypothetical protein